MEVVDHGLTVRRWAAVPGSVLVALSAVAFSTAGLFTRLIDADVWTMLFWRGLFGGSFILAYIVLTEGKGTRSAFTAIGRPGLAAAACSTAATICFILALRQTTVAAVTIIYATAPFIAAGIGWAWMRQRPGLRTLVASLVALAGVLVMAGNGASAGKATGNILALAMTCLMALMMVIVYRQRRVSMLPGACLSALACSVAVLPLARPGMVTLTDFGWLAVFGSSQFGLGLLLLMLGNRHLPGARASLLANLELPLAPLWVWLVFGESPSLSACIGGGIVAGAVMLDAAPRRAFDLASLGRLRTALRFTERA
jgi:drug/metabolite transporter (DMT)-like permease